MNEREKLLQKENFELHERVKKLEDELIVQKQLNQELIKKLTNLENKH